MRGFHLRLLTHLAPASPSAVSSSEEPRAPYSPLPSPIARIVVESFDAHDWEHSSDALTDWLNARWAKSGYRVSKEVVCFTLRLTGRDARMALGYRGEGGFVREGIVDV